MFASYSPTIACMTSPNDRHGVYMSFMDRRGWQCQFLEADLKTSLRHANLHQRPQEAARRAGT